MSRAASTGGRTSVAGDDAEEDADRREDWRPAATVVGTAVAGVRDVETNRWTGVVAIAVLFGGLGIMFRQPAILLGGVFGVVYAAYVRAATPPVLDLAVERRLSTASPEPGDAVSVTVIVRNEGDGVIPDLRLVDGVPGPLTVSDGTPRLATALLPGDSASFTYSVEAIRGEHRFDPVTVVARDFSGAIERRGEIDPGSRFVCVSDLQSTTEMPLRSLTTRYTGRVPTDLGGEGVEFHAVRDYRPGDSLSRIDWNRRARSGELATLEFREERSASVMLLVDARRAAYVRPDGDARHAVDRSVDAAGRVCSTLLDHGDRVGVMGFGPEKCWLTPGSGSDHEAAVQELFGTNDALSSAATTESTFVGLELRKIRKRLADDAQIVMFSPLCDDDILRVARLLEAHGHLVTVVSPDPTSDGTPGRRLAGAERRNRLSELRAAGIRVVDWPRGTELATVLTEAARGWRA